MTLLSSRPLLFTTLRFGKYSGKRLEHIVTSDSSYIEWLLKQKERALPKKRTGSIRLSTI